MGDVIEFKRKSIRVGGVNIVEEDLPEGFYQFLEKPAAKSTTFVMQAGVCQLCGHKLDGQKNASKGADGKACICGCHPKD